MNVPAHSELSTLWRFSKQDREARCVLLRHPAGLEMRYVFNGVVLIGMVSGDEGLLMERAHQWRLRLVADGCAVGRNEWWPTTSASGSSVSTVTRLRACARGAA